MNLNCEPRALKVDLLVEKLNTAKLLCQFVFVT